MKKVALFALLTTAAFGTRAQAQVLTLINPTTNNGSFETSPAAQTDFTTPTSATAAIPFWGASAADTNSGVTGGNTVEAGTKGAFLQPGGAGAAFNLVTSRPIQAGDVFTLTFYAADTGGGTGPVTATLFSQAAPAAGTAYAYTPADTFGTLTSPITASFAQYTLTATATAADVGNDVGINLSNGSALGGTFDGIDNIVLTVSAVPEPSTCAIFAVGGLGLVMALRRRLA